MTAPTRLASVRFRHLANAPRPLKHNAEVKCFVGAAETVARVRLLEGDQLLPGEMAWLQLELRDPLPLGRGDRFILRYPSPGETIGGGDVLEAEARRAVRHGKREAVARLEALAGGDLPRLMASAAARPLKLETLAAQLDLDEASAAEALNTALAMRMVLDLGDGWWLSRTAFEPLRERVGQVLGDFHQAEPMRAGLRPERLRSALGLETVDPAGFAALIRTLTDQGLIQVTRSRLIALAGHTVRWSKAQRAAVEKLLKAFAESPYTPPSPKEAAERVGADVLAGLLETGELRQIAPDVLLSAATYQEWLTAVRETLERAGRIDVRMLRDRFHTSRKYALGFLEYLGSLGLTRREGDDHVLASADWSRAEQP